MCVCQSLLVNTNYKHHIQALLIVLTHKDHVDGSFDANFTLKPKFSTFPHFILYTKLILTCHMINDINGITINNKSLCTVLNIVFKQDFFIYWVSNKCFCQNLFPLNFLTENLLLQNLNLFDVKCSKANTIFPFLAHTNHYYRSSNKTTLKISQ